MRKAVIGGIITTAVAAAIGGYFLVTPLFIVTEVNDPIPTETLQTYQDFIAMSEEDRMQMAAQISEEKKNMVMIGAAQVTASVDENIAGMSEQEMEKATMEVTRTGMFVGVGGHAANGVAKILSVKGNEYLRFEEFMVTNGPDLRVYLTSGGDVKNGEHFGKLNGSKGDQNYSLVSIETSKYDTVVIFCQPFRVVFATATLEEGSSVMVVDYINLIDHMRAAGAIVEPSGEISQPFFSVKAQVITVNGGDVQVFEYADIDDAEAEAGLVSPDDSSIGTSMVNWVATPHFYKSGKLLVLYVGDDTTIIDALEAVLDAQFAGR